MEVVSEDIPDESTENSLPDISKIKASLPQLTCQQAPKKSKKDEKNSKKDDKSVEQFLKSLNSITNPDEKISIISKKYVQTCEDNKKLLFYIKQSDRRHTMLLKEKEHLQLEFNKSVLVKSKLENLCREMQKQNKAIKEESLLKIREEEERRKETQAKFQNTLSEITTLLQQNNEKNIKLRDDNISMGEKFKSVVQQYQLREEQVDKMAKQMTLESQLADAKLQKANLEHQADKERLLAEMEHLKVTVAQYKAKVMEQQGTETALKGQLAVYTDKYDEFQNALVKSNQVFGGFKDQMELMSKKIKKLEKESLSWKKRWETSQTALLDMCGERQASEERVSATTRQLHHMQSLCRTLQAERTLLMNTLKENNIERPPLPAPTPAPQTPAQTPAGDAKVDAMVANCAQLRQSLAHLQTQLNVLTNNKNGTPEEPVKQEKPKKSKSKKGKSDKQAQKANSDVKETENGEASTSKAALNLNQDNASVTEIQDVDIAGKVDEDTHDQINDKTMESLIQAINIANVDLRDLETANEAVHQKINIVNDLAQAVEELKAGDSGVKPIDESNPGDAASIERVKSIESNHQPAEESSINNASHSVEVQPILQE